MLLQQLQVGLQLPDIEIEHSQVQSFEGFVFCQGFRDTITEVDVPKAL